MKHDHSRFRRSSSIVVAVSSLLALFAGTSLALAQQTGSINHGPSGLPLPRFVSLKGEHVNMRVGPGKQYAIAWKYLRAGLPLEIIQEYDNWRRVRDSEGTTGWIHGALLSGKRTAITSPWQRSNESGSTLALHDSRKTKSDVIAYLKPGVIGELTQCDGVWCEMTVSAGSMSLTGYASQAELWGAYPDENFD